MIPFCCIYTKIKNLLIKKSELKIYCEYYIVIFYYKGEMKMDDIFKQVILIFIKSIVSFAIAGAYALFEIAMFGDNGRMSEGKSIIVLLISISLGCWIVNAFTKKK